MLLIMPPIPLWAVNLHLSPACGTVISDQTELRSAAMLAITLIAIYLVAMAALNIFDFGRVD